MLKKYFFILTIIAAFILIAYQGYLVRQLKTTTQVLEVEVSTMKDSVKVHKSKSDELTFKLTSTEVDKTNLKKSLEIAGYDIKNWKTREIDWRNTEFILRAEIKAFGKGVIILHDTIVTPPKVDTVVAQVGKWDNKHLFLTPLVINKNIEFDYLYQTGITIVPTTKRGSTTVNISLTDPKAVITSASSMIITKRKRWYEKGWLWGVIGFVTGVLIVN